MSNSGTGGADWLNSGPDGGVDWSKADWRDPIPFAWLCRAMGVDPPAPADNEPDDASPDAPDTDNKE